MNSVAVVTLVMAFYSSFTHKLDSSYNLQTSTSTSTITTTTTTTTTPVTTMGGGGGGGGNGGSMMTRTIDHGESCHLDELNSSTSQGMFIIINYHH